MESAGELELDLRSVVEWSDRWLVTFNVNKTKLRSFNRHRDPPLVPVEMNGIGLPEETSFRLLGLTFIRSMDCKPLPRLIQGKWTHYIGPSVSLLLNPFLHLDKSTIRPCMEYCFHIWDGAPRSHGLDLLDRVQKRVVSLVDSGLSAGLQVLTRRMDVANLGLFNKCYYGKCSSELARRIHLNRVTVKSTRFFEQMHRHTVNSPVCRTTFYQ